MRLIHKYMSVPKKKTSFNLWIPIKADSLSVKYVNSIMNMFMLV